MKRSALERRTELQRRTPLARKPLAPAPVSLPPPSDVPHYTTTGAIRPVKRRAVSPASKAQRAKVRDRPCIVCGASDCDPAHVVSRAQGGCDHPDCVVPLYRRCHIYPLTVGIPAHGKPAPKPLGVKVAL